MKNDSDHGAFLEDIEAPMWVDLAVEAELSNKELDDEWFHRSHKFHQLPGSKLKAAFKQVSSGGMLEIDNEGPSYPKLPSSVSKSRGKYSESLKLGKDCRISVSSKESLINNREGEALSSHFGNRKQRESLSKALKPSVMLDQGNGSGRMVLDCFNGSVELSTDDTNGLNPLPTQVSREDEKSTVTSESSQRPGAEVVDTSTHIIGRRSTLLSVMKLTLRKSCSIRMATRGQMTEGRQTNGRKSSTSKSSMGSCSVQSHDTKDTDIPAGKRTSKTPESKNVSRMYQESGTRSKVNTSMIGGPQITKITSEFVDRREPPKGKAKTTNSSSQCPINRHSPSTSTSLVTHTANTGSKCDDRGNVRMPKFVSTVTVAKSYLCPNGRGKGSMPMAFKDSVVSKASEQVNGRAKSSVPKFSKAATVKKASEHANVRGKITMTGTLSKTSGCNEVGKRIVVKPSDQKLELSKALPLRRRPLTPMKENIQGSLSIVKKATKYGMADATNNGKENLFGKVVSSKEQGGNCFSGGGMGNKNYRPKLTEARKNNIIGVASREELRREPTVAVKPRIR